MSEEQWKLQVSFKVGQDMINVRAGTGAELEILLGDVAELAPKITATQVTLGGVGALAPLSMQGTTPATTQHQDSQTISAQPASGMGPTCQHGNRVYRQGISKKTGQPYAFWACPTPQGTPDQCKPVN